jgi:hypothetical protein
MDETWVVKQKQTVKSMKKMFWLVGGLCAAAAGFLVLGVRRRPEPVEELAHRLEEAWSDHHTQA